MSRTLKRQLDSSSESETENFDEVTSSISQALDLEASSSILATKWIQLSCYYTGLKV